MKGFTLPEVLVALLLSTLVLGSVLALVLPVQGLTQAQLEATDLQQRLRAAVRRISVDIAAAKIAAITSQTMPAGIRSMTNPRNT